MDPHVDAPLFRLLIESVPIGVAVLDADLRLLHINRRHARLNKLPIEQQLGRQLHEFLPQAAAVVEPKVRFVLDTGMPLINQEIRASEPDADGRYLYRLASYYPWQGDDGVPRGVLAIIQDSSNDEFAVRLHQESEKRLLQVLDNLYCFVGVLALDGTLLDANRAPLEAAGISIEQVRGKKVWDTYWWSYDADRQATLQADIARCRNGEVLRYDVQVRMAHDELVWIDFMLAPLRNAEGVITHLIPSAIDISQRHASEAALHQSEERYRSVVESSEDAIVTKSLDGRITSWNMGAQRLLGYTADEAIGQPITMLFAPEFLAEEAELMRRLISGERVPPFETVRIHKDGHPVDLSITISPLHDRHGKVVGACKIARDISEQKRNREAMRRALDEKTALLHEVHHRVKNNLQIVSSLLKLQTRRESPEVQRALLESQGRIKAMALVHQLLYESSSMAEINLVEYLQRLIALIGATHGVNNLGIALDFDASTAMVNLDIQRAIPCGLVINELIVNAIKHAFTGRSAGLIAVTLAQRADGWAAIRVTDNGCGLPADFSWESEGGLGKQLIPMFVAQLQGDLQVNSSEGGASFLIAFDPDLQEEADESRTHTHR